MNSLSIAVFAIVLAAANAGVIGLHGGLVGLGGHGLIGSGIEGQYVPSGLELLHDDGSYRAEHHLAGHGGVVGLGYAGLGLGHGLGLGLGGLVGSGIEGQYVPSGNELHHDDGSYRAEHHLAGLWH